MFMKTIYLGMFLFFINCLFINAQSETKTEIIKIFKSYDSYKGNDYFMCQDFTNLNSEDSLILTKESIWGMEIGGNLYRIFDNSIYLVEDTSGLIIYSLLKVESSVNYNTTWIPISLGADFPYGFPFGKYDVFDEAKKYYYFSLGFEGRLYELDKDILINIISNELFVEEVKKTFKAIKWDISDYDDITGQFRVNKIYNKYFSY